MPLLLSSHRKNEITNTQIYLSSTRAANICHLQNRESDILNILSSGGGFVVFIWNCFSTWHNTFCAFKLACMCGVWFSRQTIESYQPLLQNTFFDQSQKQKGEDKRVLNIKKKEQRGDEDCVFSFWAVRVNSIFKQKTVDGREEFHRLRLKSHPYSELSSLLLFLPSLQSWRCCTFFPCSELCGLFLLLPCLQS